MRTCYVAALFTYGLLAGLCLAKPVDLSAPGGELGAANPKGYLQIWREIEDVGLQLGKGSYLPLRYKFSSDPTTNGILGPGFYLPMFEAKNVLIREGTMRAYLPCGKGLYLWRDTVDPNKFLTPDKAWTGYMTGDDFVVWRDDGWKVLYHKNRLTSITSDDNQTFNWVYTDAGGVTVSTNNQTVITLEPNTAGQVTAITFNSKRYEVEYGRRPITEMLMGQVAIKELTPALSIFKYPDGAVDSFKFSLTPERTPMLNFTDRDKQLTVYTWNPMTSYLATENGSEGNWTYQVGKVATESTAPSLSRTSNDGQTEGITIDAKMGTYTSRASDGTTTITHVFETPGPLYHKVKSIDKVTNNQSATIYKSSYDEAGRLIRKVDKNGFVTTYQYDDNGHQLGYQVKLSSDPTLLALLAKQERDFLNRIKNSVSQSDRNDAFYSLSDFYISSMLDFDKASSLLSQIHNRDEVYNIKLFLAISNPNLPVAQRNEMLNQLAQDFPDKQNYTNSLKITEEKVNEP